MTCELRDRKPSEAYAKRSVRCRTQHRQVWFAQVVLCALIGSSLSANNIQMTENVASTILSLQQGKLNFMATLKRTDSTNVGTFVYHEFGPPSTTNTQKFRFFDSELVAGYVHNYELSWQSSGQLFRGIFRPAESQLYYNRSSTHNPASVILYLTLSYNTGTSRFSITTGADASLGGSGRLTPLKSDDLVPRIVGRATTIFWWAFNPSLSGQATKTISAEEASSFEYIDQVSKIGIYALYIHRSGLLVWDDEITAGSNVNTKTQIVADFQPKFAVKDSSRTCTDANCDVIIFQERNSNIYHLSMLNVKITSAPTVGTLKFA